jgi:Domain of unknown function (DUF222)/HNH endonuclease
MGGVWQEVRGSGNWVLHLVGHLRTIEHVFASSPDRPDFGTWSDAALCREIKERSVAVERAQAELTRLTGVWLARQAWRSESGLSSRSWLAEHTPMTRASAARLCTTARLVHSHEQTAKALDVGDVTVAHVEVLATAARRREALYAAHEDVLLDAARTLTPDDLVTAARQWRELADDTLSAADAAAAHASRYLHVSPTMGGGRIDGFLDPDAAATLIRALDELVPPDPAGTPDPRAKSVRNADALVMLAQQWLDDPERAGHTEASLEVRLDVGILGRCGRDEFGSGCELRDHGPIGRALMERLACDAKVARIVMDGESRVLDLGRSTRVVSPALRKAVTMRDRHCQHPGCRAPAKWCDVHHLVHWINGGATDLDNLVLLCRRHHVAHHEGGWHITREDDGSIGAAPSVTQPFVRRRRR